MFHVGFMQVMQIIEAKQAKIYNNYKNTGLKLLVITQYNKRYNYKER